MPNDRPRIAVDAMGGDFGPKVVVPGALAGARKSNASVILVGREQDISPVLEKEDAKGLDVEVVHASEIIGMEEKPSEALRRKKDSSLQVAFHLVKDGKADGVVSAGNSGAILACGMFILGRIKGVERPAFASIMPTEKKTLVLTDVGANVDCKPVQLFQFGLMANVLSKKVRGIENPRVGLMSIGEEAGKGNIQVKEAFNLFHNSSLNFVGNVEGRDVFTGDVDVVVCDGFVGNVILKVSEGLGLSLSRIIKRELTRTLVSTFGAWLARGSLGRLRRFMDYATYGGAPFLGLKGIPIICHGSSNPKAISSAVGMAATFVYSKANQLLIHELSENRELTLYAKKANSKSREKSSEEPDQTYPQA